MSFTELAGTFAQDSVVQRTLSQPYFVEEEEEIGEHIAFKYGAHLKRGFPVLASILMRKVLEKYNAAEAKNFTLRCLRIAGSKVEKNEQKLDKLTRRIDLVAAPLTDLVAAEKEQRHPSLLNLRPSSPNAGSSDALPRTQSTRINIDEQIYQPLFTLLDQIQDEPLKDQVSKATEQLLDILKENPSLTAENLLLAIQTNIRASHRNNAKIIDHLVNSFALIETYYKSFYPSFENLSCDQTTIYECLQKIDHVLTEAGKEYDEATLLILAIYSLNQIYLRTSQEYKTYSKLLPAVITALNFDAQLVDSYSFRVQQSLPTPSEKKKRCCTML